MHHIGLVVKDLDLSSDFYCKALGFKKGNSYTTETLDIIFLEKEKITLELIHYKDRPYEPRNSGPFDHIAFEVSDINKTIDDLKSLGITINETPRSSVIGKKIVFFNGPDGERLELVEAAK